MNTASRGYAPTETGRRSDPGPDAGRQWSLWTWIAVLLMVNLPLLWGEVRHGWLYLPEAVAGGQWWRVITYPLVHLSWYHLLLDAGGFLLLLFCLEEKRKLVKTIYIVGAGAGTLLLASVLDPLLAQRGLCGLSGIAHGLMAISALEMMRHKGQRKWGLFSLAVVVSKSSYELWSGHVVFEFMHMGLCGQPLAASHAGGVVGGLAAYLILNIPFLDPRQVTACKLQQAVQYLCGNICRSNSD